MAEIEARLVGMIQAPTQKFTKFCMKNVHHFMSNLHNFSANCLKVELFYASSELEKVVFQKKEILETFCHFISTYLMSEKQVRQKSRQETSANFCVFRTFSEEFEMNTANMD